ncbi:MAG: S8 family peptidase, partial [Minisyncoccales bacterium]
MEKRALKLLIIILILLFVLSSFFLVKHLSITGFFSYSDKSQKTSSEVLNELQKKETIRVVVEIDDSSKGIRLFGKKGFNKKQLPGKIRHDFGDKISLEITQEELENLEKNSNIKRIGLVGKKQLFLQDSVPLVNGTSSWDLTINNTNLTGKGQTVCVIDTGANFSHPDLYGKNQTCVINCVNSSGEGCVENCSIADSDGHGTHVSGIIAANGSIKGVAPDSKLIMIKVFEESNSAYDDDIAAGIDWCVNNASKFNISVISMSLGGGNFSSYCDEYQDGDGIPSSVNNSIDLVTPINNAISKNISVVAATGNSGNHTHIASPACIQNATAVGMTYDKDVGGREWDDNNGDYLCNDSSTSADKIVCASNRNNITDLFAPGAIIYSTWKTGYKEDGGTSMAAPHVAGAFALINQFKKLETNKTLKPENIQNTLILTGKRIYDNDSGLNFSRINIYSAILSL